MRLPVDACWWIFAFGLSAVLAGCTMTGGGDRVQPLTAAQATAESGPAADFPMVLGDPFAVDGVLFTPVDALNYDAVGHAALDDGAGVTAAHRTLPLPSYVEVTSLESGKTILVRVERRGPMTGTHLVALSRDAATQLGAIADTPVRVRRVNPTEAERAKLRAGGSVAERMETPKSLVEVLRRKLPAAGAVTLSSVAPLQPASSHTMPHPEPAPVSTAPVSIVPPVVSGASVTASTAPAPKGGFLIQAGAFASRANADRAAKAIGGFVIPSGRLFVVRTGPFPARAQADAALAKVRAAGYSDARVTTHH